MLWCPLTQTHLVFTRVPDDGDGPKTLVVLVSLLQTVVRSWPSGTGTKWPQREDCTQKCSQVQVEVVGKRGVKSIQVSNKQSKDVYQLFLHNDLMTIGHRNSHFKGWCIDILLVRKHAQYPFREFWKSQQGFYKYNQKFWQIFCEYRWNFCQ